MKAGLGLTWDNLAHPENTAVARTVYRKPMIRRLGVDMRWREEAPFALAVRFPY